MCANSGADVHYWVTAATATPQKKKQKHEQDSIQLVHQRGEQKGGVRGLTPVILNCALREAQWLKATRIPNKEHQHYSRSLD